MPRLTSQEIDAYLAGPHVAHFASIRQDGTHTYRRFGTDGKTVK